MKPIHGFREIAVYYVIHVITSINLYFHLKNTKYSKNIHKKQTQWRSRLESQKRPVSSLPLNNKYTTRIGKLKKTKGTRHGKDGHKNRKTRRGSSI